MDLILNAGVTLLTFLYSIVGQDMVLAIVVFTVLVRLATYPLTNQQLKSSQAMQQLQPELKKLQEKYKNDREKLAQEQMVLYRQYGVSPVGGCLPLLIQFPIFIALYQSIIHALASTPMQLMDVSGRFFIPGLENLIPLQNIWLGLDLTQPPPISNPPSTIALIVALAMPILTMATTWLSFKISMPAPQPSEDGKPNPAASMSQSMGTIMPLMYGFFALSFSVGLSIYFIVSNLIQIAQYILTGRANFGNLFGRRAPVAATASPSKVEVKASPTTKGAKVNNVPARKPAPKTGSKAK
jgi:YidC/Oxa1 family membrane protein insertase